MKHFFISACAIALLLCASAHTQKTHFSNKTLVGTWITEVTEFGNSASIMWEMFADGTQQFWLFYGDGTYECKKGKWQYHNAIIYESSESCPSMSGKIDFLDENHFNLTILHNCSERYEGQNIVRKYRRYR
jgi:hypothetical protein